MYLTIELIIMTFIYMYFQTSENIVRTVDKILDIDDDELKKTKKANRY